MSTIAQNEWLAKIPLVQLEAKIEQFVEPVSKRLPDQRLKKVVRLAVRGISAAQSPLIRQLNLKVYRKVLAMCEDIRFYCGVSERSWNYYPPAPGPFACVSPVYGSTIDRKRTSTPALPFRTEVIHDSGAFSDGNRRHRLSFHDALARQEKHAERYGYAGQIAARASYDLLIDEMWLEDESIGGIFRRQKRSWTETSAEEAVEETVQAARFLAAPAHRNGIPCVLSAQGVTPRQYLRCVQQIVPLLQTDDILGLGG